MKILLTLFPIIVLLFSGCTKSPTPPLRVATIPWPGYESLHIAQERGYFTPAQVRLVELASSSQSAKAFRNGTVDVALLTLDETLGLLQYGVDLRAVLVLDISNGADVVMSKPEISSVQALRGKRIGVETTAIGALMFDALLTEAALSVVDVEIVNIVVHEHAAAYREGRVDAVVTFEPVRTKLLAEGAKILFDSSQIPGRIVDVMVARAGVLESQPEALKVLIGAHFAALDYLNSEPHAAAALLAPYLGVAEVDVLPQFAGLKLPTLVDNHALLSGKPSSLLATAAHLAELMRRQNLLERKVNLDHLVDSRFLPVAAP